MDDTRRAMSRMVESIDPVDPVEFAHQRVVLDWLGGDQPIYRTAPDAPDPHLVSYFVVVDPTCFDVLLGAHRKAGLWLPTGGHVQQNEHPWHAVERECAEELRLAATPLDALGRQPLFLTVNRTRGGHQHTDVSLWFVLAAEKDGVAWFDEAEFSEIRWFTAPALQAEPIEHLDPHMHRFMSKLASIVG